MSAKIEHPGSAEPTADVPAISRSHLATWVSPKVIDTQIRSKTAKEAGGVAEDQAGDLGMHYKPGS